MTSERYTQDKLFGRNGLPKKNYPEHYYVERGIRRNFYPSQAKYIDNNFAVIQLGEETRVLSRQDYPKFFNCRRNEWGYIKTLFSSEWVDNPEIIYNPENLKELKVVKGKLLEKATRSEIGGKSLGEVELKKYEPIGYKVPEFMVIPTSFTDVLQTHGFIGRAEAIMKTFSSAEDVARRENVSFEFVAGIVPTEIEELFKSMKVFRNLFVPFILPEVNKFYFENREKGKEFKLIFRSSSPLEDGDEHLFQGVFTSRSTNFFIDDGGGHYDNGRGIFEIFKSVMLSPWTTYAESYLRSRNLIGKVSRSVAVMCQVVPNNLEFVGRAYFDNDKTEVEYLDRIVESGNYVGNRIYIEGETVVNRVDNVEDNANRERGTYGKLLVNEKAIKISQIAKKLSKALPKYNGKFNLELGISKEGTIYLFQIRPTKREPPKGVLPELSQVDREKILFECSQFFSPFSIGKVVGPVVNLLGYHHYYRGEPKDGYLEEIAELDKKHPGSIFIVRLNIPSIKEINMLTPNKIGIIVCYEHDRFARNDHYVEELYRDPSFHIINVLPQLFENFENGTRLGIVSSGEKAIFYKPTASESNSIIHNPPTIFNNDSFFESLKKYKQDEINFGNKQ